MTEYEVASLALLGVIARGVAHLGEVEAQQLPPYSPLRREITAWLDSALVGVQTGATKAGAANNSSIDMG